MGLAVRGTCPVCKGIVNESATPGKATWRGPCPVSGCAGKIYARRVKEQPAPAPAPATPARKPRKVVKVDAYTKPEPKPSPAPVRPEPGPTPESDPDSGELTGGDQPAPERVAAEPKPEPKPERPKRRRSGPAYGDLFNW